MTKIEIAVCDDAYEDAKQLLQHLKLILPGAGIDIFSSGDELTELLDKKANPYSAVFLNIQMPGKSGIETARAIRKKDLFVPLIFVSSSDAFYRDAFEVFAFNYLLKPVTMERLKHVLYPLKFKWGEREDQVIHFRYRSQLYTIRHSQITYLSSSLHTVNFHLTDGDVLHCRGKLDDFRDQLESSTFLRCHQSFFVNMEEITAMKNDSFILKDYIIPISRSYAKEAHVRYSAYLKAIEHKE